MFPCRQRHHLVVPWLCTSISSAASMSHGDPRRLARMPGGCGEPEPERRYWPLRCQICWWSEVCPPHRKKASLLPFFHLFRQVWKNLYCVRNDRGKSHRASKINPSATRNVINKFSSPLTPATRKAAYRPMTTIIIAARIAHITERANRTFWIYLCPTPSCLSSFKVRNDRGRSHRASRIKPSATRNVINKSSLPSTPATLRLSDSPNTARITTVRLNQIVKVA